MMKMMVPPAGARRRSVAVALPVVLAMLTATPVAPASQKPDPAPVLAAARAALGGEKALQSVRTLVATGRARRVRGQNLVPIEFEIACELPDKFSRQDEIPAEETGLRKTGFNGRQLVQAPAPDKDEEADPAARASLVRAAKQDFARWTLALFASSFDAYPLSFTYAGRGEAPDGAADAIDAESADGFSVRLFIDVKTHLPVMLTWMTTGRGGKVEQRLYYTDYRDVGGLRWPFLIRRATGDDTVEETAIDRYRVNSKIDPRKFEAVR